MICEFCGIEHDGFFGTGRFCSDNCRRRYCASKNLKHKNNFKKPSKEGGWNCSCGLNFKTRRLLQKHRKDCSVVCLHKQNHFYLCNCSFCGKEFKTKEAKTSHEKYCQSNPNKQVFYKKGKKLSEETIKKLKKNAGGYRKGSGRGKRGYYKGLYCMSSWELAWVVFQLEHGKNVEQCQERFPYTMNGSKHYYTPDFKISGVYYEIKNWHRPDTDYKLSQFPKDKTLILIEGKQQNEIYIKYVENKYGKNFWEMLYE